MLSEKQEQELTGSGECMSHWHSPRYGNRDIQALRELENTRTVAASGTLSPDDDYVLVDTSTGSVSLVLPKRPGKFIVLVKTAAANTLTATAPAGFSVMGGASVSTTAAWGVLRLKLIGTVWVGV